MIVTKICAECRWHRPVNRDGYKGHFCIHDVARDEVDGEPRLRCADMRERHTLCGPEGKLFEPAPAGSGAAAGPDADREA